MRHGGSVMAPDAELAVALRPRAVRPPPGERPAVGRPPRRHRRPRRPGPAPAAARPLVQEARRLRHARQAGRRARAQSGQAKPKARSAMSAVATACRPTTAAGLDGLLRSMADDEFVIGFSDSEWTGIAPLLEEDVAMSSLAQDELGHAAALYGLLAELTGTRPGRARLRPRAGRLPPLPAARPRPRRLGDDDRPALPVRDRRRGPARGAGRRVVGAAGRAGRQARPRGALPPDARRGLARPAGPRRPASRATACWPRSTSSRRTPRRSSRHSPTSRHWSRPGSSPRRWPSSRRRWRAAIAPTFAGLDLPMPPPAARSRARPPRPRRGLRLAVGRVHDRPPRRPGSDLVSEAGIQVGVARARAGAVDGRRRPRRASTRRPSAPPSPRSRTRSCRCSRSSTSGSSIASTSRPTAVRSGSRSCRRSSAARRSSSSRRRSRSASPPSGGRSRSWRPSRSPWTSDRISPAGRRRCSRRDRAARAGIGAAATRP